MQTYGKCLVIEDNGILKVGHNRSPTIIPIFLKCVNNNNGLGPNNDEVITIPSVIPWVVHVPFQSPNRIGNCTQKLTFLIFVLGNIACGRFALVYGVR